MAIRNQDIEREQQAVSRGLQLACERCDFSALLHERAPFGPADVESTVAAPSAMTSREGYWQDELCGECRLPVRLAHYLTDGAVSGVESQPHGRCPRCGGETMSFDVAMRELAEACHSRVEIDLRDELQARERIQRAIELSTQLMGAIIAGDTTTLAAIELLSRSLSDAESEVGPARKGPLAPDLAATHTLGGLDEEIENAATLENARDVLRVRLNDSAGYIRGLEGCVQDEAFLPGVPCPQCETGRLIHWPIWI